MDDIMHRIAFSFRRRNEPATKPVRTFFPTATFHTHRQLIGLFVAFVLLTSFFASQALAVESQQLTSEQLAQMGELLRQGQQLEVEQRWDEALTHYENALREFPGERSLKRHFETSRMHFDLRRRLNDPSFCSSLARLSFDQALNLHEEILVRIQTHYVESPHWKELIDRGMDSFDVALSESVFVQKNLPNCPRKRIDAFRRGLRRELNIRPIQSRAEACAAVSWAARAAKHELGISPVAVVFEFNCGATNCLDLYSSYLTPNQLDEIYSQIEGNFVGLGIELKTQGSQLLIVRVIPNSPAQRAGLREGDEILAIDGKNIQDMSTDKAANLLQGEAGSFVVLKVAASGQLPRIIRAERRRVDVPSIDSIKIVDSQRGIGYLRLSCFQKSTSRDLDDALWKLHREGMRGGLIIDLRGNPGGLLIASVEAVDKFVEHGTIVSTRGRNVGEGHTYSARSPGTWHVPLFVLIDHDSASAAEIFAGAIRDHRRGTIIGERSYGKGSVQGIFPLHSHSSGIRLTTAKFYSPNGRPYSLVGVAPHKEVRTVARRTGTGTTATKADATLDAALQYAQTALSWPSVPTASRQR